MSSAYQKRFYVTLLLSRRLCPHLELRSAWCSCLDFGHRAADRDCTHMLWRLHAEYLLDYMRRTHELKLQLLDSPDCFRRKDETRVLDAIISYRPTHL
jgi:hypothetical protein